MPYRIPIVLPHKVALAEPETFKLFLNFYYYNIKTKLFFIVCDFVWMNQGVQTVFIYPLIKRARVV